jgi:hypothetical protein
VSCDGYILICAVLGAGIATLGVLLWVSDERCSSWKQHAEQLRAEAWHDKLGGDVIGFPDPER